MISLLQIYVLRRPTPPPTERMDLQKTYAPNLLFCFCSILFFLVFKISATLVSVPLLPFNPSENIAIYCGFSGNTTALDGRKWIGDINGSMYFVPGGSNSESIASAATTVLLQQPSPNSHAAIPYTYARISQTQFTYVFPITPGPKFVRLHFYPASYGAFQRSNAYFTVKANRYTLLYNFSASLTADALGITTVSKEFCLNVEANQPLSITFSPSRNTPSDRVYAFVNGIEVVSMPNGLYYSLKERHSEWDQRMDFTSHWGNTALETVHRLNIGGSSISSSEDTGMSREWFEDTRFFLHSGVLPLTTTMQIKYGKISNFVAPQTIYQTSWFVDPNKNSKEIFNFTWKIPVDKGFRYLFRFHFCELDYEIKECGQRVFHIYVDNYIVEPHGDIIKWSGEIGVATYKDYFYVVEGDRMDGKRNILISLCPVGSNIHREESDEASDVILKGLEIFKINNPDNNLAASNPLVVHSTLAVTTILVNKHKPMCISVIVIIVTMLSVICYRLPNQSNKEVMFPQQYGGLCRRFSLAEVWFATKKFDNDLVIGEGGFGKVYKGCIDGGKTIVAMKRLNVRSKQGASEFYTEIEMLSKLRNINLVTLIGYCNEGSEMILVYEYMARGTLADHLYKIKRQGRDSARPLSWEQRLNICIDAARGLAFLHNCNKRGIIHRDVKSTNILLDENLVTKIADFGLSKVVPTNHSISHISTSVKGTFGYLDPEYFLTRRLTKKSDVYAFGVVLWEVLCGRPAIDTNIEGPERSLVLWSQYCFSEGVVDQIMEPILRGQISATCLKIFTQVANLCLNNDPTQRPSMKHVVANLEHASLAMKQIECFQLGNEFYESSKEEQLLDEGKVKNREKTTKIWRKDSHLGVAKRGRDVDIFGKLREFEFKDLRKATNNFAEKNKLVQAGNGVVYRGYLQSENLEVAVKCFSGTGGITRGQSDFLSELAIITRFRHKHLVPVRGWCLKNGKLLLVYKFMANGSLDMYLFDPDDSSKALSWDLRYKIISGVASALHYLHNVYDQRVVHRDLKTSSNIMIDTHFNAGLGDLGLARAVDAEKTSYGEAGEVPGRTLGYNVPEYSFLTGKATQQSDVYAFGAVLLEVVCGIGAGSKMMGEYQLLVDWVWSLYREGRLLEAVDERLRVKQKKKFKPEEAERILLLGLACSHPNASERPKTETIPQIISGSMQIEMDEEITETNSFILHSPPPPSDDLHSSKVVHFEDEQYRNIIRNIIKRWIEHR